MADQHLRYFVELHFLIGRHSVEISDSRGHLNDSRGQLQDSRSQFAESRGQVVKEEYDETNSDDDDAEPLPSFAMSSQPQ